MTTPKLGRPTWPHAEALEVATLVQQHLEPACHRIVVAGSLRRSAPTVHDIELLCVPQEAQHFDVDLFGHRVAHPDEDMLTDTVGRLLREGYFTRRGALGPKNMFLVHAESGIPVDVFSTTEENWGMSLLVRTGPATFNIALMATLRHMGMRGHAYGGITGPAGAEYECPDERTVFTYAGWPYIVPEKRL